MQELKKAKSSLRLLKQKMMDKTLVNKSTISVSPSLSHLNVTQGIASKNGQSRGASKSKNGASFGHSLVEQAFNRSNS